MFVHPVTIAVVCGAVSLWATAVERQHFRTIVVTGSGAYQGNVGKSRNGRHFYQWLGIPYAEPPIGRLRFEPPVPIRPHTGILDAGKYAQKCPQVENALRTFTGDEDCLYLNVYAPRLQDDRRARRGRQDLSLLPVMFFIHGGYFLANSGKDFMPHYFMDEDVVVVSINYRLGVLGFLNTGDGLVRGNMGLKDQALALQWVHKNIRYFGGDQTRITVLGQSAGAVSAHLHLLSPVSQPLIYRVISQSGTALAHWGLNRDPLTQAKWYANITGCAFPTTEMVRCLKMMKAQDLLKFWQTTSVFVSGSTWTKKNLFVPTIETVHDSTTFLSDDPWTLLNRGQFTRVPWLSGSNSGEGLILAARFFNNMTERALLMNHWATMADQVLSLGAKGKILADDVKHFYFPKAQVLDLESDDTFISIRDIISDRNFFVPEQDALKLHAKFAPVHAYYYNKSADVSVFNVLSSLSGAKPPLVEVAVGVAGRWFNKLFKHKPPTRPQVSYGACHGDEMFFLNPLGMVNITPRHKEYPFSRQLVKLWVQFAYGRRDMEFQGSKVEPFNQAAEFRRFVIQGAHSGMQVAPFWNRYLFWKKFENLASSQRISNKIL